MKMTRWFKCAAGGLLVAAVVGCGQPAVDVDQASSAESLATHAACDGCVDDLGDCVWAGESACHGGMPTYCQPDGRTAHSGYWAWWSQKWCAGGGPSQSAGFSCQQRWHRGSGWNAFCGDGNDDPYCKHVGDCNW